MQGTITFPDKTTAINLGQGTWHMGENAKKRQQEIVALRTGIQNGVNVIDTAEMYGEGKSEELIAEAIQPFNRKDLFIISKVYPYNAGKNNIFNSCNASLQRLGTSYLDLYLMHWRGSVPLAETVECMQTLVEQGKIRRWGVSNFDVEDMEELFAVPGGKNCAANQVLYHMDSRGAEYALLPWLRQKGVPMIAYSPMGSFTQSRQKMFSNNVVQAIAQKHGVQPAQVALAFVLAQPGVLAIPQSSSALHAQQNAACLTLHLSNEDIAALSAVFLPPTRKQPLDML